METREEYLKKKELRAKAAQDHTEIMSTKYVKEIENCINKTKTYGKDYLDLKNKLKNGYIRTRVVDMDSVSALFKFKQGKTCVLNFASYRYAGGNFINGSIAQEECLCLESFLFNVLNEKIEFYQWNEQNLNNGLYTNRAMYSPNVVFEHNNEICTYDVLTCASPNYTAAKSKEVSLDDNSKALRSRIKMVIRILIDNEVETAILGAFGCGVFGQNPIEVAEIFKEELNRYYNNKRINVIFAIPSGNDNFKSFKQVF